MNLKCKLYYNYKYTKTIINKTAFYLYIYTYLFQLVAKAPHTNVFQNIWMF